MAIIGGVCESPAGARLKLSVKTWREAMQFSKLRTSKADLLGPRLIFQKK